MMKPGHRPVSSARDMSSKHLGESRNTVDPESILLTYSELMSVELLLLLNGCRKSRLNLLLKTPPLGFGRLRSCSANFCRFQRKGNAEGVNGFCWPQGALPKLLQVFHIFSYILCYFQNAKDGNNKNIMLKK